MPGVLVADAVCSEEGDGLLLSARVLHDLGFDVYPAVTCLRWRAGGSSLAKMPLRVVQGQIDAAAPGALAAVIGCLPSGEHVNAVFHRLHRRKIQPVVFHPMLNSREGHSLLHSRGLDRLKSFLSSVDCLVVHEDSLLQLAPANFRDEDELDCAAQVLIERGARAILLLASAHDGHDKMYLGGSIAQRPTTWPAPAAAVAAAIAAGLASGEAAEAAYQMVPQRLGKPRHPPESQRALNPQE